MDGKVVDRREPKSHEPVIIELPILIAIGAIPVTRIVVPFASEPHRNAVPGERPQFLDEPVIQLLDPLVRKKSGDFISPIDELRAIPPARINRVCQSYF